MARGQRGPTDPGRRARIARAAVDVVETAGIGALTHRAVAERAGVPLGSTTYHFANREELIVAAMYEAMGDYQAQLAAWSATLADATVAEQLAKFLVAVTDGPDKRVRVLIEYELYLAGARAQRLRNVSIVWDDLLRQALEQHVDPASAHALNALATGLLIDSLVRDTPLQLDVARDLLSRLVPAARSSAPAVSH